MNIKKTISGALVTVAALGGAAAPEAIEMNKEYSIEDVNTMIQEPKTISKSKAEILSKIFIARENAIMGKRKFLYKGYKIEIISKEEVDGLLKVVVRAESNGKALKLNNPYMFKNPPIKVPDGTKRTETIEGVDVELDNFKIDPEAALKEIILQTIELGQNKSQEK